MESIAMYFQSKKNLSTRILRHGFHSGRGEEVGVALCGLGGGDGCHDT